MNFYEFTKLEFNILYHSRSVLLIEKNGSIRKKLDNAFKSKDFKVAACEDITSAKKWLKEGSIDVVVIDFDRHISDMGLDAVNQKLKQLEDYPVIAICDDEVEGAILEKAGAYSHIVRPINLDRLVRRVEQLFDEN